MSRTTKATGSALTLLALASLIYWLWSSAPTIRLENPHTQPPAIALEKAQLSKYDASGTKIWQLQARLMETDEIESAAADVILIFFDAQGRETLVVRAARARMQNQTGDVELVGTVSATGSEFSFTTENLVWDNQKKTLSTDSFVRVNREDFAFTGRGFEYSSETGLATIKSEARLSVH